MPIKFCPECGRTPSMERQNAEWKYVCCECLKTWLVIDLTKVDSVGFHLLYQNGNEFEFLEGDVEDALDIIDKGVSQ